MSDSYSLAFDEMFDARATSASPTKASTPSWPVGRLRARSPSEALGRAFIDQGITFSLSGQERPFPLDLVPG